MEFSKEAITALQIAAKEKHSIVNLEQLGVSQKIINLLESYDLSTLDKLLNITKKQLLSIDNFGPKQLKILFNALSKYDALIDC